MRRRIVLALLLTAFVVTEVAAVKCLEKEVSLPITEEAEAVEPLAAVTVLNVKILPEETKAENLVDEIYCDSIELLGLLVEAEAGNQSVLGKQLVVDVVLNRVDSEDFPNTIEEVIKQKNAFTAYKNGSVDRIQEVSPGTYLAIELELEERTNSEILYFTSEGFSKFGKDWKKVGDHYFSTKK